MRLPAPLMPTRRVERHGEGYVVYVKPPIFFGLPEVAVQLTADQYQRYQQWLKEGGFIQVVLADLSATQREILMSGLDDHAFHKFAGAEDDE